MGLNGLIFQWRELCLYCLPDVIFQYLLGDNGDAPNLSLWPGTPERGLYILVSIENGEISLLTAIPEKKCNIKKGWLYYTGSSLLWLIGGWMTTSRDHSVTTQDNAPMTCWRSMTVMTTVSLSFKVPIKGPTNFYVRCHF